MRSVLLALALSAAAVQPAGAATFSNPAPLRVASHPSFTNQADTYPAPITVSGLSGAVTRATVTIKQLSSGDATYVDALLVAPSGARSVIFSDIYHSSGGPNPNHVTITFDDAAPMEAPAAGPYGPDEALVRFKPTNREGASSDEWPGQAAQGEVIPASLGTFVGGAPNGVWSLYLSHEPFAIAPISTRIDGGWSLDLETTGPGPPPPPDRTAPVVSRVSTDDSSFRAAARGGPVGPTGALIGFRLDEAATISFDVDRLLPGRRVRRRCLAPAKRRRRAKRCTRVRPVPGSFTVAGRPGDNTFRFTGRLNGRKLKPGRYRLTGVAVDAAGNRAAPFSVKLTIKKPRKRKR